MELLDLHQKQRRLTEILGKENSREFDFCYKSGRHLKNFSGLSDDKDRFFWPTTSMGRHQAR